MNFRTHKIGLSPRPQKKNPSLGSFQVVLDPLAPLLLGFAIFGLSGLNLGVYAIWGYLALCIATW